MNYFKDYVENPVKLGMICIIEIVMSWWINKFKHSPEIISIKQQRLGALREAFKIVQVDGYYFHLFLGLFWAISLLFLIFWGIKERKYIASLIYIVFLIILGYILGSNCHYFFNYFNCRQFNRVIYGFISSRFNCT